MCVVVVNDKVSFCILFSHRLHEQLSCPSPISHEPALYCRVERSVILKVVALYMGFSRRVSQSRSQNQSQLIRPAAKCQLCYMSSNHWRLLPEDCCCCRIWDSISLLGQQRAVLKRRLGIMNRETTMSAILHRLHYKPPKLWMQIFLPYGAPDSWVSLSL